MYHYQHSGSETTSAPAVSPSISLPATCEQAPGTTIHINGPCQAAQHAESSNNESLISSKRACLDDAYDSVSDAIIHEENVASMLEIRRLAHQKLRRKQAVKMKLLNTVGKNYYSMRRTAPDSDRKFIHLEVSSESYNETINCLADAFMPDTDNLTATNRLSSIVQMQLGLMSPRQNPLERGSISTYTEFPSVRQRKTEIRARGGSVFLEMSKYDYGHNFSKDLRDYLMWPSRIAGPDDCSHGRSFHRKVQLHNTPPVNDSMIAGAPLCQVYYQLEELRSMYTLTRGADSIRLFLGEIVRNIGIQHCEMGLDSNADRRIYIYTRRIKPNAGSEPIVEWSMSSIYGPGLQLIIDLANMTQEFGERINKIGDIDSTRMLTYHGPRFHVDYEYYQLILPQESYRLSDTNDQPSTADDIKDQLSTADDIKDQLSTADNMKNHNCI